MREGAPQSREKAQSLQGTREANVCPLRALLIKEGLKGFPSAMRCGLLRRRLIHSGARRVPTIDLDLPESTVVAQVRRLQRNQTNHRPVESAQSSSPTVTRPLPHAPTGASTPPYPGVPGCTRVYPGVPGCTPPYPTVAHRTSPYPTVPHATPPYPTLPHPNPTLTHAITHTIAPTLTPTLSPTLTPTLYPHPHPHPPPPHPLPATFYPRTLYLVPSVLF